MRLDSILKAAERQQVKRSSNMSRSDWRDGEVHKLLTSTGEKAREDGERWGEIRKSSKGTFLTRLLSG